jgi:hypothetical protein
MNPMKYPQSYLALEAAQFDRQPRMAPPLTWDDREAQQIPSYEQTAISPDPLIDLGAGFSGGFGANIMRKGLSSALRSGIAATLAEYPIGLATAGAANIDPRLAMPVSIMGGMASGPTFERALSNAMAGKGHPLNARRALGNAMGQVDVWHGSPHSFDRFSMDKIGTGEGAQAFGHGLYFTDTKYIAEHYAKNLGDIEIKNWSINGIPIYKNGRPIDYRSGDNNFSQAKALFQEHMMIYEADIRNAFEKSQKEGLEAIQRHTDDLIDVYGDDDSSWSKSVVKYFKAMRPKDTSRIKWDVKSHQSLYKATLHKGKDPSEYVYLDWDKPASESVISNIREAGINIYNPNRDKRFSKENFDRLADLGGKMSKNGNLPSDEMKEWKKLKKQYKIDKDRIYPGETGEDLYRKLQRAFGSDKEASLFLKRAGIDGIRYPSGSLSGGSGQGKNYVVFDENAITIEEINGKRQISAPIVDFYGPNNAMQIPMLPPPETAKQHLARATARHDAWKKKASRMADQAGKKPVVLTERGTNKRGVIIHKSTKRPGKYQITYWDDTGFSGDTQADSLKKAIEEALQERYETINPNAFNKAVKSKRFAAYTKANELFHKNWAGGEKGEGVIALGP